MFVLLFGCKPKFTTIEKTARLAIIKSEIAANPLIVINDTIFGEFKERNISKRYLVNIPQKNIFTIPKESIFTEKLWGEQALKGVVYVSTPQKKSIITLDGPSQARKPVYLLDGKEVSQSEVKNFKRRDIEKVYVMKRRKDSLTVFFITSKK